MISRRYNAQDDEVGKTILAAMVAILTPHAEGLTKKNAGECIRVTVRVKGKLASPAAFGGP